MTTETQSPARNLLTVRQFSQKHPAFPEGGLRYQIFHAKQNGLADALRRIGRKVLIDEVAYFHWIDAQNRQGGAV
jgi:hypothetical protein